MRKVYNLYTNLKLFLKINCQKTSKIQGKHKKNFITTKILKFEKNHPIFKISCNFKNQKYQKSMFFSIKCANCKIKMNFLFFVLHFLYYEYILLNNLFKTFLNKERNSKGA